MNTPQSQSSSEGQDFLEPLGNKNPLLPHQPLGQMALGLQFMAPVGAKSISILDPSIFNLNETVQRSDLSQPFTELPFFQPTDLNTPNALLTANTSSVLPKRSLQQDIPKIQAEPAPSAFEFPLTESVASAVVPRADGGKNNVSIQRESAANTSPMQPTVSSDRFPQSGSEIPPKRTTTLSSATLGATPTDSGMSASEATTSEARNNTEIQRAIPPEVSPDQSADLPNDIHQQENTVEFNNSASLLLNKESATPEPSGSAVDSSETVLAVENIAAVEENKTAEVQRAIAPEVPSVRQAISSDDSPSQAALGSQRITTPATAEVKNYNEIHRFRVSWSSGGLLCNSISRI